jgi:lipoprotein-anchoring transpeptidase ErfK/SrfK
MRNTTDATLRHIPRPARFARPALALALAVALAACGRARAQSAPSPDSGRPSAQRADSVRFSPARVEPATGEAPRAEAPRTETVSTGAVAVAAPARRSFAESPATLQASLTARQIDVVQDGQVVKSYKVAIGKDAHPTPRGAFRVRRVVWNPSWHPPDEKWARNKTPKGPGEKGNPMKVVKIFFREPDYYIHGTGDIASLGKAASHGCLRMDPSEAAELAQMVMESGGSSFGWDTVRRWLRLGSTRAVTLKRPVTLQIS